MRWEGWKYKRYERRMFAAFDHVLFVSAADRDVVASDLGCDHIAIVPQGVDTDYYNPEGPGIEPAPEPYVLITGMMNYAPNAASAIYFVKEVLPLLRRDHPEVGCMIVGAYPTDEVKALAQIDSKVTVTGFVEDMLPYMRSASVYAAPAISGTGIKNKVLQAMAMELGIVATPLSMDGIPVAKHEEHVLIVDGAQALADAVSRLLDDPDTSRRLGKKARACIKEHYSWPAIVGYLFELLGESGNPPRFGCEIGPLDKSGNPPPASRTPPGRGG